MARVAINTGSIANDGTGDTLRAAGGIINSNFSDIYNYFGDGTNLNFSGGNWEVTAVGINTLSSVGIGTTNPRFDLEVGAVGASGTSLWVNGNARVTGILTVGTASIILDGTSNTISVGSGVTINGDTGIIDATSIVVGGTTITGAGVTRIEAGSGISVDQNTGQVTITATGGGGESYWAQNATGIHTLSNVGIGTTNPVSGYNLTLGNDSSLGRVSNSLKVHGYGDINGLIIKGNSTTGTGPYYTDNVVITQHPASTFTGGRNVAIGDYSFTTPGAAGENVAIGYYALNVVGNNNTSSAYNGNTAVGAFAGQSGTTTLRNTFIGYGAGRYVTTGDENTILGSYDGNQNDLDIRTSSNNVVLSDGAGNIRLIANAAGNVGLGTTNPTSKLSVNGGIQLAQNNATIVGTSGTAGEIKQIAGSPFYYDGSAWREFVLSSGTPVTEPADTEWDNVIFRATFDDDYTDAKFGAIPVATGAGTTIVNSPVKIGTGCYRNEGDLSGGIAYPHRSEYDFNGPWTIEFWMYLDTVPTSGNYVSLVSKNYGTSADENWALCFYIDGSGNYEFNWMNDNASSIQTLYEQNSSVAEPIFLRKWAHIALVREPSDGSLHFYVNGQETTQTAVTGVVDNDILNNVNARLGIGGGAAGYFIAISTVNNGLTIDAHFDDVRITTVARYTSVGITTDITFTPPTTALPTSGTLSSVVNPPGDKYGEITLGGSPTWRGTSGVTVSQQSSGNYRISFASTYTNANDYFVLSHPMDQGFASYVGIARSTSHVDFSINKQSDDSAVDTGSLAVQIKNHP